LISKSQKKSDRRDAELLARLAASDPKLLSPITHRGEQAQRDLAIIKLRDMLVRGRLGLVASLRGIFESLGITLPGCSTQCFHKRMRAVLSKDDLALAEPMLTAIEALTQSILKCDREIERAATHDYPETKILQTAPGVGPIVSLAFVLTLDDPSRFKRSRVVGAFTGLTPRKHQSGDSDPELGITKAGNKYLRKLLVLSAHRILGRFGAECDLRDWGLKLAQRGGKNAKKRAVVAVARKLATILHRMWVTKTDFIPRRDVPRPIIKHILKPNKKERNARSA
jgi:transposase